MAGLWPPMIRTRRRRGPGPLQAGLGDAAQADALGAELASDEDGVARLKGLISEEDVAFLEQVVDTCTQTTGSIAVIDFEQVGIRRLDLTACRKGGLLKRAEE